MIIINENNLVKLLAEENMMLHREDCFTTEVALGCNDRPEYWNEITLDEAEKLIEEIDKNIDLPEDLIV